MLKNITVLEKLKPMELLQDNSNFKDALKLLTPFFQFDFATATAEERKIFYYNLLYVAQKDLSLAHCIQHNHKARVAIELGDSNIGKDILSSHKYHEIVCCYSSHRAVDTIRFDPATNTITPGVKGWLSNLKSASLCSIEVADISAPAFSSAHIQHVKDITPDVYTVFIDLTKVKHTITDGTESPTAVGMKGAAPGTLTLLEPVSVGTDACYLIKENPRQDMSYTWLEYVRQCWVTVHLGVILGLYKEIMKYKEFHDPVLSHKLKTIELDMSALKIMWEHGLETWSLDDLASNNNNPVLKDTVTFRMRNTQYAASKKLLLELIQFVLEVGVNDFIDDNTPQWIRFKDAITYVTHMASLYRCNNKYKNYNEFLI